MPRIVENRGEITAEWLETVLENTYGPVKVDLKKVEDGTRPGENFGSEMVKVSLDVSKKTADCFPLDLMIKMVPVGAMQGIVKTMGTFERECNAYTKVAAAIEEWQKEKLGKLVYRAPMPHCYFASFSEDGLGVIVMEHLKTKGFRLYPKQLGMDLKHAKIAVEVMARLHAVSLAMRLENPETPLPEQMGMEGIAFDPNHGLFDFIRQIAPGAGQNLIGLIKNVPGQEENLKIMENLAATGEIAEEMAKGFGRPEEPLAIVHGDFWNNNMLFRHDESGNPIELVMVDFQNCRYGNRTHDLGYFIYTSTTPEFRKEHIKDVLHHYHDAFVAMLKEVTSKEYKYSFEDLLQDMEKSAKFAFATALMVIPMIMVNEEDSQDVTKMADIDEFFEKHGEYLEKKGNEATIQRIIGLMDEMRAKGVI